ncbi:hypothetical protein FALCPG4_015843 [Fusarium falciforme]
MWWNFDPDTGPMVPGLTSFTKYQQLLLTPPTASVGFFWFDFAHTADTAELYPVIAITDELFADRVDYAVHHILSCLLTSFLLHKIVCKRLHKAQQFFHLLVDTL